MKNILRSKLAVLNTFKHEYLIIPLGLLLIVGIFWVVILMTPVNQPHQNIVIVIPEGLNLHQIARHLYELDVIGDVKRFELAVRIMGREKRLRAGRFNLKRVSNYYELIRTLADWELEYIKVTVPEGYTSRQIAAILEKKLGINQQHFLDLVNNRTIVARYGFDSPSLEGYLFPATYYFLEGDSPEYIINAMVEKFNQVVNDSLKYIIKKKGLTVHKVVTLASIVEGECRVDAERPIVASLYFNRLKKRMKLEADPTIQYIIPDAPRRIKLVDLKIDSPYNTYKYYGLPPGPINNPGEKSIRAVIFPAKTKYIYMVSNGDGTHTFTEKYEEFLEAKKRLQELRRQLAQGQEVQN